MFPRLYEQTGLTWRDGEILLVAGRVDHKGEEVSLLADLVVEWDEATVAGPEAFARQVAAGERGSGRRGAGWSGNGNGHGNGPGEAAGRQLVAVGPGQPVAVGVAYVSPRRGGGTGGEVAPSLPPIAPGEPVSTYVSAAGTVIGPDDDDEPAVPDEARARIVADATSEAPLDAGPESVLHVRFAGSAPADRVVGAMETFKAVLRDRPGSTRVVIHIPTPAGGMPLPTELRRGVAYDAELLAEVRRRLGDGLVELRLA